MKKFFVQKSTKQSGFVILFTILITVIIIMMGLGIYSVATRETVLSGTSREAQAAFYAADAGIECALYAQSLGEDSPLTENGGTFDCGNNDAVLVTYTGESYEFDILVGSGTSATCAHVTVFDEMLNGAIVGRRAIAQGYNICNPSTAKPIRTNPMLVERDLDTTYQLIDTSTLPPIDSGTGG